MPKSQVPQYNTPLPNSRLRRAPHPTPLSQKLLPDPPARSITVLPFLSRDVSGVRSQPELRRPVLRRHGDEGDVDDQREGVRRVIEVGVRVYRLALGCRAGQGRHGGVGGAEGPFWAGAEDCRCDLGCDGVCWLGQR